MFEFLKKLLGGIRPDIKILLENGATVLDVRTKGEFEQGHVQDSINIPLDQIASKLSSIQKMKQPIITCCASGMRSGSAKLILKSKGIEAYNGGSWISVQNKL